jgi:hypothetical protein
MKTLLRILGILAVVMGVLWMAQGSGIFPYPAASFMISQTSWVYRGGILAAAGIAAVGFSRRMK